MSRWLMNVPASLLVLALLLSTSHAHAASGSEDADADGGQPRSCSAAERSARPAGTDDAEACSIAELDVLDRVVLPERAPMAVHAILPDSLNQQQQQQQMMMLGQGQRAGEAATAEDNPSAGSGVADAADATPPSPDTSAAVEASPATTAAVKALPQATADVEASPGASVAVEGSSQATAAVEASPGTTAALEASSETTAAVEGTAPAAALSSEQLEQDLQRLQGLLAAARQAVSDLSLAVSQQEGKMRALYGAGAAAVLGPLSTAGPAAPHRHQGWLSHFQVVSTLETHARATIVHGFCQSTDDTSAWELPRYVVLGDEAGKVYFFSAVGHRVLEYETGTSSPITAIASYSVRRNESVLITGHENGEVRTHGVYEVFNTSIRRLQLTTIYLNHVLTSGLGPTNITSGLRVQEPAAPITHLLAYRALGKKNGRRLVAVWDSRGWLRVQRDDGSIKYAAHALVPPQIVSVSRELMVGLSGTEAMVLRTALTTSPRSVECVGLNGSSILAAAFDPVRNFRAYAWTDTGDILSLVIPHSTRASVCKASKRLHVGGDAPSPALLVGLRGHLLALRAHPPTLHTFNTTTVVRDGAQLESSSGLHEVAAALGLTLDEEGKALEDTRPLFQVVGRSDLVALSLGGKRVVILKSNLPVPRGLEGTTQGRGWTQIIFIFLMGAVAVFQFTKARGQRHGSYATSSARHRSDFPGIPGMPGLGGDGGGGGGGGLGGLRDSTAARLAAYHATLQDLDRSQQSAFPSRAMRRAARMAPVSTRLQERPQAIAEEEEEEVEEYPGEGEFSD